MRLPMSWLKEYVDISGVSVEELAERFSLSGSEVEYIERSNDFLHILVGEVLSVEKHPNADKLRVAKVTIGEKELTIVWSSKS